MSQSLKTAAIALALTGAVAALGGCSSVNSALGMTKVTPDEFRVVSKAPLVVPPDYALRPPAPGEPRPQELQPESSARLALLGQQEAVNRSPGESILAKKAGAGKADPLIRYVMDDEYGALSHKDKSFADKVMFWKKGAPDNSVMTEAKVAATAAATATPVDPIAEQAKIKSLTGDQDVVIARAPTNVKFKLPGL
jgi:hypothetical protein